MANENSNVPFIMCPHCNNDFSTQGLTFVVDTRNQMVQSLAELIVAAANKNPFFEMSMKMHMLLVRNRNRVAQ